MDAMLIAITKISDKSREIGKIIKSIEDIAFQTNILALNAVLAGTEMAEDTSKSIQTVVEETAKITSFIKMIAEASSDQASNVTQITLGMD